MISKKRIIGIMAICFFLFLALIQNAHSETIDQERIKADLIGKRIGDFLSYNWKFDSMSEFKEFSITGKKETKYLIEYTIDILVIGNNGNSATATLTVAYRNDDEKWHIVNVTDNNTLSGIKFGRDQSEKKLMQIEGVVVDNSHGNKNGTVTIKSGKNNVDIFFAFGDFKVSGADFFKQGDIVSAYYKPTGGDLAGELVFITIKK